MIEQLEKLSAVERLSLYVKYLKNRKYYPPDQRREMDQIFEDF